MITTYNKTAPIGKLFFQQAGAHVLAGLFAFVAIFITGHHVSTFLFDISINIPICKSWKIYVYFTPYVYSYRVHCKQPR